MWSKENKSIHVDAHFQDSLGQLIKAVSEKLSGSQADSKSTIAIFGKSWSLVKAVTLVLKMKSMGLLTGLG